MFYSVKFNRFNGYRSSRSELQISMDVIYVAFPSSKFPWSSRVVISGASSSWSTQHVLLKHPVLEFIHIFDICRGDSSWTPMSQCEEWETCFYALNHHLSNSSMRILINSLYWRVSVRVSAVLRQRACGPGYGERGSARRNSWTCWWTGASWLRWASSTGVAQGCQLHSTSTDITWWNFWCLWGWKPWKWREIVIFVRTGGCLCCECWTNLKSVYTVPNHPGKSPANKWA